MSSQVIYGRRKRLLGGICLLAAALATTGCGSRLSGPAAVQVAGPVAQVPASTDLTPTQAPAVDTGAVGVPAASGSTVPGAAPGPSQEVAVPSPGVATPGKTTGGQQAAKPAEATKVTSTTPAAGINIAGPSSQGVTDTTIKLGVIAPLSGAAGFLGEAEVAAVRAYTSLVNAQGGIRGRMYTTVIADSQFEPAIEAQAARKLVDSDKVFALFSVLGDSTGPFVTAKGITTMAFGLLPPAFSSRYNTTHVFGLSTMDSVVRMAYWTKVLQKKPIDDVAILYDTTNMNLGPWAKYLKAGWEATGAKVQSMDPFNVSDGDCTSIVLKLQNQGVDFWQAGQSLNWPACAAAMGRQGWKPSQGFGGPYTSDNKYISQGGAVGMDGVFGQNTGVQLVQSFGEPYPYDKDKSNVAPLAKAYVDSMKRYSPNSADSDTLESTWAQSFWVAVQALTKAIDAQSAAITWKGVNQWLHGQKNYQSGLIAPINFDPNCKSGAAPWVYQWKFNKTKNIFEQTPWKDYGGPFTMPDSFLNKIVPGTGQCYLTKAADNEL
jgi:ABC-type branched-subunit amino acid transport system substrate-binding protein